jgi:hypothetical protein
MTGVLCAVAGAASSGVTIQLTTPVTLFFISGGGGFAATAYRVASDGFVYTAANSTGTYSQQEQWISNVALVGDYEVRATASGDTPTGSALNTWLALSTTRSWDLTASPGNFLSTTLTVEIRDTATSTVRATATVNMTSDAL